MLSMVMADTAADLHCTFIIIHHHQHCLHHNQNCAVQVKPEFFFLNLARALHHPETTFTKSVDNRPQNSVKNRLQVIKQCNRNKNEIRYNLSLQ